ncbi:MAG: DUF1194 domain-containing protein [Alphaproteobacteria bacterium]|nr:DUF1194 domain-containing protein [Alphaproteobacteria bacterium]
MSAQFGHPVIRALFLALATVCLALACLSKASAAPREEFSIDGVEVDLELFLAVDVSRSMTRREMEIQRRGYAEALTSDPVWQAISGGMLGRIAVTYVEWAGDFDHRVIVPWTLVDDREDARAIADALTTQFVDNLRRTSISGVIDYATPAFNDNGFEGLRRVIDISGDGPNNQGRPVLWARDEALAKGVTINGLPLMTKEGMGAQWHLDDLDRYYVDCVIGGPGAFVIPVYDWADFPEAVKRKLVLEIAGLDPIAPIAPNGAMIPAADERYDCLVGEKIWRRRMQDWYN